MIKNKYIQVLAGLLLLLSTSCTEWLAEENPNQLNSGIYWSDLLETNATLTATYSALLNPHILNPLTEAARSDMGTPGFGRPTFTGRALAWYEHTYTTSSGETNRKWDGLYSGIFRANQTIEGLEALAGQVEEEERVYQLAQARCLRGMFYFYLHSAFNKGNIVLRTTVPQSAKDFNQPLSTSEEVKAFFQADLQYAYQHLPAMNDANNKTRVTKGVAATLLGTSFLYEYDYKSPDIVKIDSAMTYFKDVVDNPAYGYQLERDTLLQFTTTGAFNKESILEIPYSTTIKPEITNWDADSYTHLYSGYSSFGANRDMTFPSNWLILGYISEELDTEDPRNWINNDPTVLRHVSLRTSAMMAVVQDIHRPYYTRLAGTRISLQQNNGAGRFKHFTNHDLYETENGNPGGIWASGKPVVLNRLSEVYMNLAECYILKGELDKAIETINVIRSRWALKQLTSAEYDTAEKLLARFQNVEKPLETSIEGHCIRWFDLRRWGKLETIFQERAAQTFYPIPDTVTPGQIRLSTITDVPPADFTVTNKDYEVAAANFNYEREAWYGIPEIELVNNKGL